MCRSKNMIFSNIFFEKITIKHLKFVKFVKILKKNVKMNFESKFIHCELYELKNVKNQRCDFFRF
jgi:hypothetical protein